MEIITSDTILAKMREVSKEKKEKQYLELRSIAQTMAYNIEAIVEMVSLTGELHVNLLDKKHTASVLDTHFQNNDAWYSRLSVTSSIHTGMDHLAGNAHIYTNEDGKEAVRIVCTFKFKRDFLSPEFLSEMTKYSMEALQTRIDDMRKIFFHACPELEHSFQQELRGWYVSPEIRDNSIIVTLSEGKNK